MWAWLLLLRVSPALAGCPFLVTEEHGALRVERGQGSQGSQGSLSSHPECADNTLLTNSRGDQFCVAKQPRNSAAND